MLKAAAEETESLIRDLPMYQQEWVSLWELCQSQRYGQGMTIGTLVHSEIWNNLRNFDYRGQIKVRAFRTVVATDEIFRDFAIKAQDKKQKRGNKPDGLENIRNQMESVESRKQA